MLVIYLPQDIFLSVNSLNPVKDSHSLGLDLGLNFFFQKQAANSRYTVFVAVMQRLMPGKHLTVPGIISYR